jgi:hypothetical protein
VADVLGAAVEALQPPFEPNAESFGPHLGSVQGEHAAVGRAHASYTIKGFQQRLSEVPGVATVTLQESGGGIRFLVEMFEPAY